MEVKQGFAITPGLFVHASSSLPFGIGHFIRPSAATVVRLVVSIHTRAWATPCSPVVPAPAVRRDRAVACGNGRSMGDAEGTGISFLFVMWGKGLAGILVHGNISIHGVIPAQAGIHAVG